MCVTLFAVTVSPDVPGVALSRDMQTLISGGCRLCREVFSSLLLLVNKPAAYPRNPLLNLLPVATFTLSSSTQSGVSLKHNPLLGPKMEGGDATLVCLRAVFCDRFSGVSGN